LNIISKGGKDSKGSKSKGSAGSYSSTGEVPSFKVSDDSIEKMVLDESLVNQENE
jgi:hypothetical protein